ncbi:nucleotidyltransferase family protein [Microbacterium hydrocarbonoxydans]|uniref:nucleotidyltransferase family protein n=1 Tax=Microbacterium hydrocarbonoxydans TaxID=273678 RepID=UPI0013DA5CDF|nr:nucleotidyltransferase family protein [Microbacterium hydrocarbonoxydans]
MDAMETTPIALDVRLEFSRAAIQVIARDVGIRLLHIKGGTVDPQVRTGRRGGSDVDVIADPRRVPTLHAELVRQGWVVYSSFLEGSPFGHAQTYRHPEWGYLDLHRRFPGVRIPDEDAFDLLWADRASYAAAGIDCVTPSVDAQAVLFVLNAARDVDALGEEAASLWRRQDEEERVRRSRLVRALRAEVAFAAALGDLERYRGRREYLLWKTVSRGGTRAVEWWARIKAAPTVGEALQTMLRAPLVNRAVLAHELGREPRVGDVIRAFVRRLGRALRPRSGGKERKT